MKRQYYKRKPQEVNMEQLNIVASQCGISSLFVYTLLSRGFSYEEIQSLLTMGDSLDYPFEPLTNASQAAEIIYSHLVGNKEIRIFADYDCDGVTSGYVMFKGIEMMRNSLSSNSEIAVYYPQRSEGYGLNMSFCKQAVQDKVSLIITVDNGITQKQEIKYLKDNDVAVIVTDHHEPHKETLPDCLIVNPCYNNLSRSYLAGVAVAWNVIWELAKNNKAKFLKELIEIAVPAVAIGTISDIMPMCYENSYYVSQGLKLINEGKGGEFLSQMKQDCKGDITVTDISFTVAPKINAASRMSDVKIGAAGFYLKDPEKIGQVVKKLTLLNDERKSISKKAKAIVAKIKLNNDTRFIAMDGTRFGKGMLGIIAGEITKRYPDYPAFVYSESANGTFIGSVRCNNTSLDLPVMFEEQKAKGTLINFAGHSAACVIEVAKDKLQDFIVEFSKAFDALEIKPVLIPYDAIAKLKTINTDFLKQMNRIPFTAKEMPVFIIPNVLITNTHCSKSNPDNIRFRLSDSSAVKEVWAWGFGDKYKSMGSPKKVNIICEVCQNFMASKEDATLRIIDVVPVKEGAAA